MTNTQIIDRYAAPLIQFLAGLHDCHICTGLFFSVSLYIVDGRL